MKGNDTKNCVYNETTNIKNVDMIDTSSVFHSNCSTLNCSKQDFPIDDLTVSTFKKNDNNQFIGKKTKKTVIKIPKVIIEEQPSSPNSIESQLKKVVKNIKLTFLDLRYNYKTIHRKTNKKVYFYSNSIKAFYAILIEKGTKNILNITKTYSNNLKLTLYNKPEMLKELQCLLCSLRQ